MEISPEGKFYGSHPAQNAYSDWPSPFRAWALVLMLSFTAILSYLDRIVINLMVEPIKADLNLSDTGFAALQGIAFGVFYTAMAFPLGRLADKHCRRNIVAVGLAAFSFFSVYSGLAKNFWQLFVARIGVGVGEASLTPAAYSMISDCFPPQRLGRALSVFTMSAFIGVGVAYVAGGAVIDWLWTIDYRSVPLLGALKPWQLAFIIVGTPGLLFAPVYFLIKEPQRRDLTSSATKDTSLKGLFTEIRAIRKILGLIFLGFGIVTLAGYANMVWIPAVFIRNYGWTPAEIGFWFGLLYLVCGTAGVISAGYLSDRLTAKGFKDAPLRVAAFGFVGFTIFGGLAPIMSTPELALLLLAPAVFMVTLPYPLAATSIQLIVSNRIRGQVSALYLVFVNLIGLMVGPMLVGFLTDTVFGNPADVRYSLAAINLGCGPLAFCVLYYVMRPYHHLRFSLEYKPK